MSTSEDLLREAYSATHELLKDPKLARSSGMGGTSNPGDLLLLRAEAHLR